MPNEVEQFLSLWEYEHGLTHSLLKTLPEGSYDFRPDPAGRSMGELAWHLSELEYIMSRLASERDFAAAMSYRLERPRTIPELATGYERVHREAVERVRGL